MGIKEVLEKVNGFALILNDEDKSYKFCSSACYAKNLNCDYIYLPILENGEEIFEQIKTHLNNLNCKGFFIDKKILDIPENQYNYHKIMKEFSSKIEVIVLVRNVFNSALAICEENMKNFSPDIITLAGSEEKGVLASMLSYILSHKGQTYSSVSSSGPWQKFFEPLLLTDEKTKYCIVDIDPKRKGITQHASKIIKNNTIIFSKTSANYTSVYTDIENYIYEITSIADYPENVKNIFTYDENELINENISTSENLNIIYESKIKTKIKKQNFSQKKYLEIEYDNLKLETQNYSYFIPRCSVISALCAKSLKIDNKIIEKCFKNFKDISSLYVENKLENNNYSVLSTSEHTHYSIKKSIFTFCKKYKNFKKILVLSRITGLKECDKQLHNDIIKQAAKENFDTAVLIDMSEYGAYYRKFDKFTHIKKISSKNNKLDERELMDIGIFLKGKIDTNTAILVCTNPTLNLEFLF